MRDFRRVTSPRSSESRTVVSQDSSNRLERRIPSRGGKGEAANEPHRLTMTECSYELSAPGRQRRRLRLQRLLIIRTTSRSVRKPSGEDFGRPGWWRESSRKCTADREARKKYDCSGRTPIGTGRLSSGPRSYGATNLRYNCTTATVASTTGSRKTSRLTHDRPVGQ